MQAKQPAGSSSSKPIETEESEAKYCQSGPSMPSSSNIGRNFLSVLVKV